MNVTNINHEILRITCFRCISMNDLSKEYEHYYKASHKINVFLDIFRSEMCLKLSFLDYTILYLFDHAE